MLTSKFIFCTGRELIDKSDSKWKFSSNECDAAGASSEINLTFHIALRMAHNIRCTLMGERA